MRDIKRVVKIGAAIPAWWDDQGKWWYTTYILNMTNISRYRIELSENLNLIWIVLKPSLTNQKRGSWFKLTRLWNNQWDLKTKFYLSVNCVMLRFFFLSCRWKTETVMAQLSAIRTTIGIAIGRQACTILRPRGYVSKYFITCVDTPQSYLFALGSINAHLDRLSLELPT